MLWLVEHLPEEAATAASMRGGQHLRNWTSAVALQASVVNLLYVANRQRANKPTKKLPIQPPKEKNRRRIVRVADMVARSQAADQARPTTQ